MCKISNDKVVSENVMKNFHLKGGLKVEFIIYEGEIMKGALVIVNYIYRICTLRTHSNWRHKLGSPSRIEYVIPSDKIIVLE